MLTVAQKNEVNARVVHFVNLGNKLFNSDLPIPKVGYVTRESYAGMARYHKKSVIFNAVLLVDNWDEFMNNVIPHEIAHLIKTHIFGHNKHCELNSSHGKYWRHIMRRMGATPSKWHTMDTSKIAKQEFMYICPKCSKDVTIGRIQHNEIVNQNAVYAHVTCTSHALEFKKEL